MDHFRAGDHLSATHHIAREFGKWFSDLSAIFVTEELFSAECVLKQKLKIYPFTAIIEYVLPLNLLTFLLSYMISGKNPSYFSQLFYAPCCLNALLPFLASFLSDL